MIQTESISPARHERMSQAIQFMIRISFDLPYLKFIQTDTKPQLSSFNAIKS